MDGNGYPIDEELEKIKGCTYEETDAVLEFVASIWYSADFGVGREDGVLYLATGGWSGNEELIETMMQNLCIRSRWICSSRGGAHEFEVAFNREHYNSRFMLARKIRELTKDLEHGFMPGAYARLKELQEAERRVETLSAELATVNERLRLAQHEAKICTRQERQEESQTVLSLRQELDKYLKPEVPHVL